MTTGTITSASPFRNRGQRYVAGRRDDEPGPSARHQITGLGQKPQECGQMRRRTGEADAWLAPSRLSARGATPTAPVRRLGGIGVSRGADRARRQRAARIADANRGLALPRCSDRQIPITPRLDMVYDLNQPSAFLAACPGRQTEYPRNCCTRRSSKYPSRRYLASEATPRTR